MMGLLGWFLAGVVFHYLTHGRREKMGDYIKRETALEMFDEWVEATGALPKGTSYYYECRACIEDVPAEDVVPAAHGSGEGPCDGAGVAPAVYAAVCKERDDLKAELQRVIAELHESRSEMEPKDKTAADVAPVVHGEWVISSDGYYQYCSVCLKTPESGVMTKHCPECGARMDGE